MEFGSDFEAYLKKFPNGHFTDLAWRRLDALRAVSNPSATGGATVPAPLASAIAGKRVAIKVVSQCQSDPDPLGLLPGSDTYFDCGADVLNLVRAKVVQTFAAKGVFASVGDDNPDLILTVTLTKITEVTHLGVDMTEMSSNYRLTDLAGHVLTSGTTDIEYNASVFDFSPYTDKIFQSFADKLVTEVTAGTASGTTVTASSPAGSSSPQSVKTPASPPQPDDK